MMLLQMVLHDSMQKLGDLETYQQEIFKIRCSEIVFCDNINLPADTITTYVQRTHCNLVHLATFHHHHPSHPPLIKFIVCVYIYV